MNEEELLALINFRLARASETLEEAHLMQREGHWNTCANRLYYAAFYAVSALLVKDNFTAAKHTGIKAMFTDTTSKRELSQRKTAVSTIVYSICARRGIT